MQDQYVNQYVGLNKVYIGRENSKFAWTVDTSEARLSFSPLQWLTGGLKYSLSVNLSSFNEGTRAKKITRKKRKSPTSTGPGLTSH